MDAIDKIRELAELMADQGLVELDLEDSEMKVRLKTSGAVQAPSATTIVTPSHATHHAPVAGAAPATPAEEAAAQTAAARDGLVEITSPMVGTFYRSPAEDADPYVSVGSVVDTESVVCIVEAMKVMNEVHSEVSGEIVEVLVQNAEPIEFGQVLFLVKPSD